MLKVMVVDDEENIRVGIAEGIDWSSYELEVVCLAENGREALALAQQFRPHIIIFDINMPHMSGLEFTREAKHFLPESVFIVLSGYDEFEYAQESIQLGVHDYLLKPISPDELMSAVLRAQEKILTLMKQDQFIANLEEQVKEFVPFMREKLIADLIHQRFHPIEVLEQLAYLEIEFPSDKFAVIVLEVEQTLQYQGSIEASRQLTLFAVKNIVDETVHQQQWGLSLIANEGNLEILIAFGSGDHANYNMALNKIMDTIKYNIEHFLKMSVSIGHGNVYSGLQQIHYSYQEAFHALKYDKLRYDNASSYSQPQPNEAILYLNLYPLEKEVEFIQYLKAGNNRGFNVIDEIFEEIVNTAELSNKLDVGKAVARLLLLSVNRLLTQMKINFESLNPGYDKFMLQEFYFTELEDLVQELKEYVRASLLLILSSKGSTYRKEIEEVKQFIELNYAKELSLKDISANVFMNTNYLCTLFKNEVGITIYNFITKIRMEKAKSLLLENELKILEISERVGYSNTNYFSQAFKKHFGVSPNEFKGS